MLCEDPDMTTQKNQQRFNNGSFSTRPTQCQPCLEKRPRAPAGARGFHAEPRKERPHEQHLLTWGGPTQNIHGQCLLMFLMVLNDRRNLQRVFSAILMWFGCLQS